MTDFNNWIYHNTEDNKARFALGKKGNKTLLCIGINPSTANPSELDNTLKTVKRLSKNFGYDSWLMLNCYPQRATNPNNIDIQINKFYHQENLKHIEHILKHGNYDIWAAWGTLIEKRKFLIDCLIDIYNISKHYNIQRYTIGKKSKKGHPHHPLYLNKDSTLDKFDMIEYLKTRITIMK